MDAVDLLAPVMGEDCPWVCLLGAAFDLQDAEAPGNVTEFLRSDDYWAYLTQWIQSAGPQFAQLGGAILRGVLPARVIDLETAIPTELTSANLWAAREDRFEGSELPNLPTELGPFAGALVRLKMGSLLRPGDPMQSVLMQMQVHVPSFRHLLPKTILPSDEQVRALVRQIAPGFPTPFLAAVRTNARGRERLDAAVQLAKKWCDPSGSAAKPSFARLPMNGIVEQVAEQLWQAREEEVSSADVDKKPSLRQTALRFFDAKLLDRLRSEGRYTGENRKDPTKDRAGFLKRVAEFSKQDSRDWGVR